MMAGWVPERPSSIDDSAAAMTALPTDLEDPIVYLALARLAELIEDCHRRCDAVNYTQPLLGTTFSGQMQATVMVSSRSEQPIIVFERELLPFVNHFVTLFVRALPSESDGATTEYSFDFSKITDSIEQRREFASSWLEGLLYAYLVEGSVGASGLPPSRDGHDALANELTETVAMLFLAHEYGHLQGRHFSNEREGAHEDELETAQIEELQADCLGAITTAECCAALGRSLPLVAAAIAIYATLPHVVARAIHVVHWGDPSTFPPTNPRYPDWRVRGLGAIDAASQIPAAEGMRDVMCAAFDGTATAVLKMMEATLPNLVDLHRQGIKLRSRFLWAYNP